MNSQEPPSEGPGTEPSIGKDSLPALGPVEVPQLEPFPENPNRILLVEDREDDAMYFKRILGHAGFAMPVYTVNDGNSAIAYLQGDPPYANRTKYPLPSIVMLDLYMPNKGGFEVLSWIRARPQFRNIFVAVLTGAGKIQDIAEAYRLGANSFVTKPCQAEDLQNFAHNFPAHWSISPKPGGGP